MDMIMTNVANAVNHERQFPLKLHAERVASDTAIDDVVTNFGELAKMFEQDIANVEKLDTPLASAMREVFNLVKDTFSQFHVHVLQRESAISKNFEEYKNIMNEQYGAVMTLELGKTHNSLMAWRQNILNHQMQNTAVVQNTVTAQNQMSNQMIAELKKNFNDLKLRHGLVVAEKKEAEQKVLQLERVVQAKAASSIFQGAAAHQKEIQQWMDKVMELEATIKFKDEQFLRDEAMVKHAQDARAKAEEDIEKLKKDFNLKKRSKEENEELRSANQEFNMESQDPATDHTELDEVKSSLYEDLKKRSDNLVKRAQQEATEAVKRAEVAQKNACDAEKLAAGINLENQRLSDEANQQNKIIVELQAQVAKTSDYAEILEHLRISSLAEARQLVSKFHDVEQKNVNLQAGTLSLRKNNRVSFEENISMKKQPNVEKAACIADVKRLDKQLEAEKTQHTAEKAQVAQRSAQLETMGQQIAVQKVQHSAKLHEVNAKHQEAFDVLEQKHKTCIEQIEAKHKTEVEKVEEKNKAGIAELEEKHKTETKQIEEMHKTAIEELKSEHQKQTELLKKQIQTAELEKSAANESAESRLLDVEAEKKKIDTLASENARLSFQITTDRAHFEAERKAAKRNIDDKMMEIERLESDVYRLASKLKTATTSACSKNPFATPSSQAVAALEAQTEQPDNLIHRSAPFHYKVVPNPSSPKAALHAAERRIAALEGFNKMLTLLLEEGVKYRTAPHVRAILVDKGLYAAKPYRSYVDPNYWREVSELAERAQDIPDEEAVKLLAAPAPVEKVDDMIIDYDECY